VSTGIAIVTWMLITAAGNPARPLARAAGTVSPSAAPLAAGAATPMATWAATPQPTSQLLGTLTLTAAGPGRLVPGSDPRELPRPLLISDEQNNRLLIIDRDGRTMWEFPRSGDLAAGQTFKTPDDAYFTPDGAQIIATQGDDNVISVIDIATRKIVAD